MDSFIGDGLSAAKRPGTPGGSNRSAAAPTVNEQNTKL